MNRRGRPSKKKVEQDIELTEEELQAANNPELIKIIKELKILYQNKQTLESEIQQLSTQIQELSLKKDEGSLQELEKLEVAFSNKKIQLQKLDTQIKEVQHNKNSIQRGYASKVTYKDLALGDEVFEDVDTEDVLRSSTQDALFESQVNDFQRGVSKHQYKTDYTYRNPDESLSDLNISPHATPFKETVKYNPSAIEENNVDTKKKRKQDEVIDMIMKANDETYKDLTRKEAILLDLYIRIASAVREGQDINMDDVDLDLLSNSPSENLDMSLQDSTALDPFVDDDTSISGELDAE